MEAEIKSQSMRSIEGSKEPTIRTNNELFDSWLSKDGGLVAPSCILLSGDSGSGKTTIVVNLMKWLKNVKSHMYSREMRDGAVKDQTKNVVFEHDNAFIADERRLPHFEDFMKEIKVIQPKVIIIDSLQAVTEQDFPHLSEEEAEKYVVSTLRKWADETNGVVILICHNTKDGDYKGCAAIKQYLDAHAVTRFDLKTKSRKILFEKNRKGRVGELFYDFEEKGVVFYTPEQWAIKTQKDRNFSKSILDTIQSYLDTADKKTENYASFKKDYIFAKKELEKINDGAEHVAAVVKLMSQLTYKYGI